MAEPGQEEVKGNQDAAAVWAKIDRNIVCVWAVHEVETTVDFCPHNRILTWLLGGLNFQIEHHLFRVSHTRTIRRSRRSCSGIASSMT